MVEGVSWNKRKLLAVLHKTNRVGALSRPFADNSLSILEQHRLAA